MGLGRFRRPRASSDRRCRKPRHRAGRAASQHLQPNRRGNEGGCACRLRIFGSRNRQDACPVSQHRQNTYSKAPIQDGCAISSGICATDGVRSRAARPALIPFPSQSDNERHCKTEKYGKVLKGHPLPAQSIDFSIRDRASSVPFPWYRRRIRPEFLPASSCWHSHLPSDDRRVLRSSSHRF